MKVRFGVITDLHSEYIPDSVQRMRSFLDTCLARNVDFCIQLGDFCPPGEKNIEHKRGILSLLRRFPRPFYHVIGNHDTDENVKSDVLNFVGGGSPYTSFDVGGVHFVILDACYYRDADGCHSYEKGNHKHAPDGAIISVIPPAELEWLKRDLEGTILPSVIFSHQSLIESRASIENTEELRAIFREARGGVVLAVCGHEHVDRLEHRDGTAYYCLNSASYYWAGSKYSHSTYGDEIEGAYPQIRKVFPYRDPLFAVIDIKDGEISVSGVSSNIVGTLPSEVGFHKDGLCDPICASVTDRRWKIRLLS